MRLAMKNRAITARCTDSLNESKLLLVWISCYSEDRKEYWFLCKEKESKAMKTHILLPTRKENPNILIGEGPREETSGICGEDVWTWALLWWKGRMQCNAFLDSQSVCQRQGTNLERLFTYRSSIPSPTHVTNNGIMSVCCRSVDLSVSLLVCWLVSLTHLVWVIFERPLHHWLWLIAQYWF